jgi:hypothetical protein
VVVSVCFLSWLRYGSFSVELSTGCRRVDWSIGRLGEVVSVSTTLLGRGIGSLRLSYRQAGERIDCLAFSLCLGVGRSPG